jgi:hypothetical protein
MRVCALLLLLTGCVYTGSPDEADAAEIEARLLQRESVERFEGGGPAGWYWLLTTPDGWFDVLGRGSSEFVLRNGRAFPVRIGGVEGPGAFREFENEPQGLTWTGDKDLYMVEIELVDRSLVQRERLASWDPPLLLVDRGLVTLSQAGSYPAETLVVTIWVRKFLEDGVTRIAWWGYAGSVRERSHTLMRVRYFDEDCSEWPVVQRSIEAAGPANGDNWSTRAGAAAFSMLGLID